MVAAVLNLHIGAGARAEAVDHMGRRLGDAHDVVDLDAFAAIHGKASERLGLHFFAVADDVIDFAHVGKALWLDLRGAACDDDAGIRVFAPRPADHLVGVANRFRRHRAGVDDDGIVEPCFAGMAAHDFQLIGIEPAA